MELYEKLYELRRGAGLSQEELAESLDVSRQAVSKWENGSATPELGKLIELSRIYHVSVDELLSLDREGAAQEGAAQEGAAPPAEEVSSGLRSFLHRYWKGALSGLLALSLLAGGVYCVRRIRDLNERVEGLQSQLSGLQGSIAGQISSISSSVQNILEREASLISLYDSEIAQIDTEKNTCTLSFSLIPKTVTDGLSITLQLTGEGFATQSLPLSKDSFETYRGSIAVPLDNEISVAALFDSGTEKQVQQLETIYDLLAKTTPRLQYLFIPESWRSTLGSGDVYFSVSADQSDTDDVYESFLPGFLSDREITAAYVEYIADGTMFAHIPLRAEKLDWYPDAEDGALNLNAAYCLKVDEDADFSVPSGSIIDTVVNIELSDGTLLHGRIMWRKFVDGNYDSGEENFFDENGELPLEITDPA